MDAREEERTGGHTSLRAHAHGLWCKVSPAGRWSGYSYSRAGSTKTREPTPPFPRRMIVAYRSKDDDGRTRAPRGGGGAHGVLLFGQRHPRVGVPCGVLVWKERTATAGRAVECRGRASVCDLTKRVTSQGTPNPRPPKPSMSLCMSSPTGPPDGLRVKFLRLCFVTREVIGYAILARRDVTSAALPLHSTRPTAARHRGRRRQDVDILERTLATTGRRPGCGGRCPRDGVRARLESAGQAKLSSVASSPRT